MNMRQESHWPAGEIGRIDLFLSRKIARARETRGVSPETMAVLLEIPSDVLAECEAGARKIPALVLFRISQVLGVSLGEIFSDGTATDPPPSWTR